MKNSSEKRAPTLYVIIAFKLVKGTLSLATAIAVLCLSKQDLPDLFQHLLLILKLHPDTAFWTRVAEKVALVTPTGMVHMAAGILIYSLFALVEGIGLIFRVPWAGWLAIGESAFFIPLELNKLMKQPSWWLAGVLVANIVIVWYLYQNRERLFKHHHH